MFHGILQDASLSLYISYAILLFILPLLLLFLLLPVLSLLLPAILSRYVPVISAQSFSISLLRGISIRKLSVNDRALIVSVLNAVFPSAGTHVVAANGKKEDVDNGGTGNACKDVTELTIGSINLNWFLRSTVVCIKNRQVPLILPMVR